MWIERYGVYPHYKYKAPSTKSISESDHSRISKLCIPPNWKEVKISTSPVSHIQVIGKDVKGRTQYLYHPLWNILTNNEKYERMKRFSKKINLFMRRIKKDLDTKTSSNHVMAIMFNILYKTHLRIGNEIYKKENSTFGLTTLLGKHAQIIHPQTYQISLTFPGKKGVIQNVVLRDKPFYNYLMERKIKRNSEIFPEVDSLQMNEYLQSVIGDEFTCKDFRTYASNKLFLKHLKKMPYPTTQTQAKKNLVKTYENVANELGHTKHVSKRSYVMPIIHETYLKNPQPFHNGNVYKNFYQISKLN